MVVAGAGTGKTSVIIAKTGYLIKSNKCKSKEILLLAYNRAAANELSQRCYNSLGEEIKASTFHALGKEIIEEVDGKEKTVTKLATDPQKFEEFLHNVLIELRNNPETWNKLRSFIIGKLKYYRPEGDFETMSDYRAYIKSVELRTLSGELVKSFAELDIANFFFLKGVRFEYESRYPHIVKAYQPDFFLPDYGIYLEHFGIDRDGQAAPFIDTDIYQQEMKWKREIHEKHGTSLLETYSWQRFEGTLLQHLNGLLRDAGVEYAPLSDTAVFEALKQWRYVSQLGELIKTFLTHFKSNQMDFDELNERALASGDKDRALSFIEVFAFFYERYEVELSNIPDEMDFEDMIAKATEYVERGKFNVPWKYIIVDEFQDISVGRYKLLQQMLKSRDDFQFFSVGDDWQSIYRFAGSDISIMSQFRDFFGRATIVKLDKTFRFNDRIANVSGKFIQKNPNQIKKVLSTTTREDVPQVYLHWRKRDWEDGSPDETASVIEVTKSFLSDENLESKTLLLLARYNHLFEDKGLQQLLKELWPGELLQPKTIHSAKGLEADYVIVMGLTSDRYGFPSEISDDPLLNLVLAKPDNYPHAEERRLFYVAITRAKHQAHIIVDNTHPSPFALEFWNENYDVHHIGRGSDNDEFCPECKSGVIQEKASGFYSCSNFPLCAYIAPLCAECTEEHMTPPRSEMSNVFECIDGDCQGTAIVCPKCGIGAVVPKTGMYGDFLSCHIWPRCDYSRNI